MSSDSLNDQDENLLTAYHVFPRNSSPVISTTHHSSLDDPDPQYSHQHPAHYSRDTYMQSSDNEYENEHPENNYSSDDSSAGGRNDAYGADYEEDTAEIGEEDPNAVHVKERDIIYEILFKTNREGPVAGRTYYILSSPWWKAWKKYVGYNHRSTVGHYERPGPIDNNNLLDDEGEVWRNKHEEMDYVFVPHDMWDYLLEWYGGGPAIPRPCISVPRMRQASIEVRKLPVRVIWSRKSKEPINVSFSKATTIGQFIEEMSKKIKLDKENIRVYDFHNATKIKELNDMDTTFSSVPIIENQYILIEQRNKRGNWPNPKIYAKYSQSYHYRLDPTDPGKTGLANLGNTCFMASSLQCLSQTVPLVDFFLTREFEKDINRNNPLGQKGELAEQYCALLKELWSASTSVVEPRLFKKAIEKCDQRFAGYQQHDSQELLIFLLDGIHEDLNRVLVKPYVQKVEGDGKVDEEVADATWRGHKERNDSIIVDNLQGLLKSTLTCPVNRRVSTTFDPFMYLTVPIPIQTTRKLPVVIYWSNGNRPTKYGVKVDKSGTVDDLLKELSKIVNVHCDNLVLVEVFSNRFYKHFSPYNEIADIGQNDKLYAYIIERKRTPPPQTNPLSSQITNTNSVPSIEMAEASTENHTSSSTPNDPPQQSDTTTDTSMPALDNTSEISLPELIEINTNEPLSDIPLDKEENNSEEMIQLNVLWKKQEGYYTTNFGTPFIISVPKGTTVDELYVHLINYITPYLLKSPIVTELSDPDPEEPVVEGEAKIKQRSYYKLFDLVSVPSYEYSHSSYNYPLSDDNIRNKQTVAMSWYKHTYQEYLDKFKEESFDIDPSVSQSYSDQDNQDISLYDCLFAFNKEEQLGPDDPWYCSDCKEFRQAFKKFDIWSAPPILIIHLKRFSYRGKFSFREKIDQFISFPLDNFDISPFLIGPTYGIPPVYELYAVSNHYGSLGSGHYTAYGKHRDDGNWYSFHDNFVKQISPEQVQTANAYVLFYRRKDLPWSPFDKSLDTIPVEESDTEEYESSEEEGVTRDQSPIKLIEYPTTVETTSTWRDPESPWERSTASESTSTTTATADPWERDEDWRQLEKNNNNNLTSQTSDQPENGESGTSGMEESDNPYGPTQVIGKWS